MEKVAFTQTPAISGTDQYADLHALGSFVIHRVNAFLASEGVFREADDLINYFGDYLVQDPYYEVIEAFNLSPAERFILSLASASTVQPQILDILKTKSHFTGFPFTEFGGLLGQDHFNGFIPTIETALFLLGGTAPGARLSYYSLFEEEGTLRKFGLIDVSTQQNHLPPTSRVLTMSEEMLHKITNGTPYHPDYGQNFPAARLTTKATWEDLVLGADVVEEILEINAWIKYGNHLLYELNLDKKIKRGYRTLFYGPPGTGKTMTASLLGKANNMDVYRVDLSLVVSKYIGETEKNLSNVFNQAENKNWILFFDEADALFGKRTQSKDSKDRYANQEIAYLLQRIEDYPGVVILATNLKSNMDDAFSRRFQSMIYFPLPSAELRRALWKKSFPDNFTLADDIDLRMLSKQHELSGGAIINVVRYCALMAVSRENRIIYNDDIIKGITKELRKEGKVI